MPDSTLEKLSEIKHETRQRAIALCGRLESDYQFECEAGPLKNCKEWIDLKAILTHACLDR